MPVIAVDEKQLKYCEERQAYWDGFARNLERWQRTRRSYQECLAKVYRFLIPPGMRVLELGCGNGDLLAALQPSVGVGVDFSTKMLEIARQRHPELYFTAQDVHYLDLHDQFDFVVCSDLVNDLWDVQQVFEAVARHCHPGTRFVINAHSRLWEIPRRFAEATHLVQPQLTQNWMTADDIGNLLYLANFEVIRKSEEILWPFRLPLIAGFLNRYLAKLWPFKLFDLTNFIIARPQPSRAPGPEPIVTVVVAARNEEGNVPQIFDRVPQMGGGRS